MEIRADHVAAGLFIAAGLSVFALSGDLPFGSLAFPDAGFMPKLIATLMIMLGALLAVGARETKPFQDLGWGDLGHAAAVLAITAASIWLYTRLGFAMTLPLLLFALLVMVERKKLWQAALYSIAVTFIAYTLFQHLLHAPIPRGPFHF